MKWGRTMFLAGGIVLLSVPLAAGAEEKANPKPFQVELGAGGVAVPGEETLDGIIRGGLCIPDVHEFYKSNPEEHIVFSADFDLPSNSEKVPTAVTVYAEVYSGGEMIWEKPLLEHPPDPNTGKPFLVQCLFINDPSTDLATGEYTYKFRAEAVYDDKENPVSTVVSTWVPENNTFTIVD